MGNDLAEKDDVYTDDKRGRKSRNKVGRKGAEKKWSTRNSGSLVGKVLSIWVPVKMTNIPGLVLRASYYWPMRDHHTVPGGRTLSQWTAILSMGVDKHSKVVLVFDCY